MKKVFFSFLLISMTFIAYPKDYTAFEMCDYLSQKIVHFYSSNKRLPESLDELEYDNSDLKNRFEMFKNVSINGNGKNYFVISFTKSKHEYKLIDNLNQSHIFKILIDGEFYREFTNEIEGASEEYFSPSMMDMSNYDKEGLSSNDFVSSRYND